MKYGQQRLAAGRKNFIFFLCPLDGEQFITCCLLLFLICHIYFVNTDFIENSDIADIIWLLQYTGTVVDCGENPSRTALIKG